MSETMKALGKGGLFTFRGKNYAIKPFDLDGIAMFSAWLENRAWEAVERTRGKCDPEMYRERHDAVSRFVASGAFGYGSDLWNVGAKSIAGQKFIFHWMLTSAQENAGLEITERLVEDMFEEMCNDLIARMNEANSDPNLPTPPNQAGNQSESPISPPPSAENLGASCRTESAS